MKSILVGNGFNLQIDRQHALSNRNILLRVEQNLLNKDYTGIFENTITCEELRPLLRGLASLLPEVLSGDFDKYVTDDNEKKTLEQFRRQYTKSSNQYDIGMEDYFFLMRMEQKRAGDDGPQAFFHAANGMKWIFLDAIYNEGKSQHLSDNLKKRDFYRIRDMFSGYDNIFTTNYDCNLEEITGKEVLHLHGSFHILADQFIKGRLQEYCERKRGNIVAITDEWKHIYCNAIMGFCGPEKEHVQQLFKNFDFGLRGMREHILSGEINSIEDYLPYLEKVPKKDRDFVRYCVEGLLEDISLDSTTYPSDEYESITGQLDIVGLSPNNDDHIWNAIENNDRLDIIRFFYHSDADKEAAERFDDKRIMKVPSEEFWNRKHS